jgi:pentatricopeptide repeat domain-containing protein 1
VREEAGHDAVLLMDRVMSTSLHLAPDLLHLLAVGCVVIAAKQVDGPAGGLPPLPPDADVGAASGLPPAAVEQMEWNIRQVLAQDTAAISTLRCLRLFLERLGANHLDAPAAAAMAGRVAQLVRAPPHARWAGARGRRALLRGLGPPGPPHAVPAPA